ncbi:MAG: hypothetical protein E7063_00060 [Spirochaetaceae bacterium]|nr:hypothetical protein [Spirochaetaceae bacterium]
MEELRSTEILDKEIQEDARKKAQKILAKADEECKKILDSVAERIDIIRKEKQVAYEQQLEVIKKDSEAAIPLEKERFLVSFEGKAVIQAINNYLCKLNPKQVLQLLENLLNKYKKVVSDKKIKAKVFGLEQSEATSILKNVFGQSNIDSCKIITFEESGLENPQGLTFNKGIIVETIDSSIRLRATTGEIVAKILDENSMELTQTLFCGRFPQC